METNTVRRTGVIGLGAMGVQMARHMVTKGFAVAGTDINTEAMTRAATLRVRTCASAAEVGAGAEAAQLVADRAADEPAPRPAERLAQQLERAAGIAHAPSRW